MPSSAPNSPSIFDNPTRSTGSIEEKELNTNFGKTKAFANPNLQVEQKLNRNEGEENTAVRQNQYMGDFKTKASLVNVRYRDHEYPDGDLIKVLVNDKVIKPGILMESGYQGFELTLAPGFNKIDFEALNQGTSGPNTAEFEVYDEKGVMISSNRWNLATGFKATIILVKE